MTSLAVVPSPAETAIAQLATLRRDLAETTDLADGVDLVQRTDALRQWLKVARIHGEAAFEAHELHLRSLRKCGQLLIALLESEPLGPNNRQRRKNLAGLPAGRIHLPRSTLANLGIRGQDSSTWQRIGRLPEPEFEARLSALRTAGRIPSVASFVRAAHQFRRARSGRQATSTGDLLHRALDLLRQVRVISNEREVHLARAIVSLSEAWALVLDPPPPSRAIEREVSCLLCGRGRPASRPPACPSCGGRWLEA